MNCKASDILDLINKVAEKADRKPVNGQFPFIQEAVIESCKKKIHWGENYLYKKLFLKARALQKKGGGDMNLRDEYIEIIAGYAGYKSYLEFLRLKNFKLSPELVGCKGEWYSYVRCNSGEMEILISPVQIFEDGNQIMVKLKGATRNFNGELIQEGSCVCCYLQSGQKKNIHLVLKRGIAEKPNVLQGVFSGISSGGDPIAGLEVLVRQNKKSLLKNRKVKISQLLKSKISEERIVGAYFSNKKQNILKGGQASTFELNDLEK